ncbi:MAG: hypothetical protein Q7R35_08995 [Elusimicrobiota bacterium]|nr:hypothetical protein [Elusimicrobiota bacterium]
MVKLDFNLAAVRFLSSLRKLGFAVCFMAVAIVTGHIFQHVVEGTSSTLINCRVCNSLATCAAADSVQVPAPAGELTLLVEPMPEHPLIIRVSLNTSRAPPLSL